MSQRQASPGAALGAWPSDDRARANPTDDVLSAQAASAAAVRGNTPACPPISTPNSARNSETNETPSTRHSSRVPSPAISKSSSKSGISSHREMKTDVSEVKPGVMVSVSKPAPKADVVRSDDSAEKEITAYPQSAALPGTTAEELLALLDGYDVQVEGLESHLVVLDEQLTLLNTHVEISRQHRDHNHAERRALIAAKDSLEVQVRQLTQQLESSESSAMSKDDNRAHTQAHAVEEVPARTASDFTEAEPIDITKQIHWHAHFERVDQFFKRKNTNLCLSYYLHGWMSGRLKRRRRKRAQVKSTNKYSHILLNQTLQRWRNGTEGCRYRATFAKVATNSLHDTSSMVSALYFAAWRCIALTKAREREQQTNRKALQDQSDLNDKNDEILPPGQTPSAIELAELQSKLQANESELRRRREEVDDLSRTLEGLRENQNLVQGPESVPPSAPGTSKAPETRTLEFEVNVELYSEASRVPTGVEITARAADKRSEFGFELSDLEEAAVYSLETKEGSASGQLDRIRNKVHVLRNKVRAGWRASEGAWVTAGNQITSAFSRAVGAPPPPHSASAHILDASAIFAASPLQSFLGASSQEAGSKRVSEDSQAMKEASGRDARKKAQYRSPTKGGVRVNASQRAPSYSTTLSSAKSGSSVLSRGTSGGDDGVLGAVPTSAALKEVAGLLDALPLTHKAYDHHSSEIEEAFDAIFRDLALYVQRLAKKEAQRAENSPWRGKSPDDIPGEEATDAKQSKRSKKKVKIEDDKSVGQGPEPTAQNDYRGAQLKTGGQFLPDFLYVDDDQERLPAPVFKPFIYTPPKPKVSPSKQRLEDLCQTTKVAAEEISQMEKGKDVKFASYRELQKVIFEEHPQDKVLLLSSMLEAAEQKLQQREAQIRSLEKNHRSTMRVALQKVQQHFGKQAGPKHRHDDKVDHADQKTKTGQQVRLPRLAREDSPTVTKGSMPARPVLGESGARQPRPRGYANERTDAEQSKYKLSPGHQDSSLRGTWPQTLEMSRSSSGDDLKGRQTGTPVRFVDVDTLKSTLASLLALQSSPDAPVQGWPDDSLLSDMGDIISSAQVASWGGGLGWQASAGGAQQDGQDRWSPSSAIRAKSRGSSRGSRGGSAGGMGLGDLGTIVEEDL